ncbi:hypothetical protein A4X09_0g3861 [Tilletia walkeri]|uniref:Uncharacterized protein n=1 Tax=Tilletia walkeri TaxID=117179 RepID=A0A8X7N845_9BASI|nr:hypothetical protein A4X09_0g3861 [Tilletia walkeri]
MLRSTQSPRDIMTNLPNTPSHPSASAATGSLALSASCKLNSVIIGRSRLYVLRFFRDEIEHEIKSRTAHLNARVSTLANDTVTLRRLLPRLPIATRRFNLSPWSTNLRLYLVRKQVPPDRLRHHIARPSPCSCSPASGFR